MLDVIVLAIAFAFFALLPMTLSLAATCSFRALSSVSAVLSCWICARSMFDWSSNDTLKRLLWRLKSCTRCGLESGVLCCTGRL